MVFTKAGYPFFMVLQRVNAVATFESCNRESNQSTFSPLKIYQP